MSQESFRSSGVLYVSLLELYKCHRAVHMCLGFTPDLSRVSVYRCVEPSSHCSSSSIDV